LISTQSHGGAFTLLHEYGHLLVRTTSVCIGYVSLDGSSVRKTHERWCDVFAAAVLMP
jgi:Zn-dependent peptidase ImmA (M78 family)